MASSVLQNIADQTKVMTRAVNTMSQNVSTQTQVLAKTMGGLSGIMGPMKAVISGVSGAFTGLTAAILPLLTVALALKAAMAIFNFLRDSVMMFVEAGSTMGKSVGTSMEIASQAIGKLMLAVGGALAPAIKAGAEIVTVFVQVLTQSLMPAFGAMQTGFVDLQPYIDAFKIGLITAFSAIEVVLYNFSDVIGYVRDAVELKMVQVALAIGTFFLETGPQAIFDFAIIVADTIPKLPKIIYDSFVWIFNGITQMITALGQKIYEVFTSIWEFIRTGGQTAITSSTTSILSQAAGQLAAFDSMMQEQMMSLAVGDGLATNLLDGLQAREAELQQSMSDTADNLATQFNTTFQQRMSALTMPALEPKKEEDKKKDKKESGAKETETAQELTATESRLLTRGPQEGPMQQVAQASQKTAEAAEKTSQSSDKMVQLLEQLLAKQFIVAEAV